MSSLPYRTPAPLPKTRLPLLGELTIKTPCKVPWEAMVGDDRMRFCCTCSKHVHDLSAMTEDEAESFLAVHLDDDDLCVRLYRRPDGRILTSDCPTGAKKRHRRRAAVATSAAAVALTAVASAAGDLHVPRAHSPLHGLSSAFEPPRLLAGAPMRGSFPPPEVARSPLEGTGQGFGNPSGHALERIGSAVERPRMGGRTPSIRQGAVEVDGTLPPAVVSRIVRQPSACAMHSRCPDDRNGGGAMEPTARHESRAGSTYAQFVRDVANAGGYTKQAAERYAVGTLTTLEERLPIQEVRALESQLPTRLDGILAFQPVLALPTMDRRIFCWRFATRVGVPEEEAEGIVRLVFRVLRSHISAGEIRHIEGHLSEDMQSLWTGLDR